MEKTLINSLLRVYHSDKLRHPASGVLTRFVEDFNIGQRVRTSLVFSNTDRESIRKEDRNRTNQIQCSYCILLYLLSKKLLCSKIEKSTNQSSTVFQPA